MALTRDRCPRESTFATESREPSSAALSRRNRRTARHTDSCGDGQPSQPRGRSRSATVTLKSGKISLDRDAERWWSCYLLLPPPPEQTEHHDRQITWVRMGASTRWAAADAAEGISL